MLSSNLLPVAGNILLGMGRNRPNPRESLARNVKFLKDKYGYSDREIERRSGVAHKTVNNMHNNRHRVSLEAVEDVARVFGLEAWHLINPNLPADLVESPTISTLISNYAPADDQGRRHVDMVAEREATYTKRLPAPDSSDPDKEAM